VSHAAGNVIEGIFGVVKPMIGVVHLLALPGSSSFDRDAGMEPIVAAARADTEALLEAGADGILYSNEGDLPYRVDVGVEQATAMAAVVGELKPLLTLPFGVDLYWDPLATLAVGKGVGAAFVREVFIGVYESDMGQLRPDPGAAFSYRHTIGADGIAIFTNLTPEFASPLGTRSAGTRARSAVVSTLADAILVSGPMAGAEPDLEAVREVVDAVAGSAPVLLNTGAKSTNIGAFLPLVDGVIVGSDLKTGGGTWNPVDRERVRRFLDAAGAAR